MYFTDNIIATGKGSVSGEEIIQPETLTAIYLTCVSVSLVALYLFTFLLVSV